MTVIAKESYYLKSEVIVWLIRALLEIYRLYRVYFSNENNLIQIFLNMLYLYVCYKFQ